MVTAEIRGVKDVLDNIKRVTKAIAAAQNRGLLKAGNFLLHEANENYVPVWQGELKASGFVRLEKDLTGESFVTVGYTAEYAIYVHENIEGQADSLGRVFTHGAAFNMKHAHEIAEGLDPTYFFNRKPGEQAKFLERPARLHEKTMVKIVADEIAGAK